MERDDPLPLVDIHYEGGRPRFSLNESAELLLNSLADRLIAVVGVAGPARTGKSFLCNVLLDKVDGFAMGSSTTPCTKGLWIWGRPQPAGDLSMLVLDTEGLHSQQRDVTVDGVILGLALLLSSVLVYNSFGVVDEPKIAELAAVVALTRWARESSSPPFFLWCLRDFALDFKEHQTANQYLETTLSAASFPAQSEKHRLRRALTEYFPHRACLPFVRPLADESAIRLIDRRAYPDLRPQFRQSVEAFRKLVRAQLTPKRFDGRLLNGPGFARLVKELLECFNSQKTPKVRSAVERLLLAERTEAVNGLKARLDEAFEADCGREAQFPINAVRLVLGAARNLSDRRRDALLAVEVLAAGLEHLAAGLGLRAEALPAYVAGLEDGLEAPLRAGVPGLDAAAAALRRVDCGGRLPARFVLDRILGRALRYLAEAGAATAGAARSRTEELRKDLRAEGELAALATRHRIEEESFIAGFRTKIDEYAQLLASKDEELRALESCDEAQLEERVNVLEDEIEQLEREKGALSGLGRPNAQLLRNAFFADLQNGKKPSLAGKNVDELREFFNFVKESHVRHNEDLRRELEQLSFENSELKAANEDSRQSVVVLADLREKLRQLNHIRSSLSRADQQAEELAMQNSQLQKEKRALFAAVQQSALALQAKKPVPRAALVGLGSADAAELTALFSELKVSTG